MPVTSSTPVINVFLCRQTCVWHQSTVNTECTLLIIYLFQTSVLLIGAGFFWCLPLFISQPCIYLSITEGLVHLKSSTQLMTSQEDKVLVLVGMIFEHNYSITSLRRSIPRSRQSTRIARPGMLPSSERWVHAELQSKLINTLLQSVRFAVQMHLD